MIKRMGFIADSIAGATFGGASKPAAIICKRNLHITRLGR